MTNFRRVFRSKHTFLPVIHVETYEQAERNIGIARDGGADGVFLINHHVSSALLAEHFVRVRDNFPDFWMGVNFLVRRRRIAVSLAVGVCAQGLWVDNGGVNDGGVDGAIALQDHCSDLGAKEILLFGGVAFKGQKLVHDFARVARLAVPYMDVVTTSGDTTGRPPNVDKIQLMKETIGQHPLAIASGMTPENVSQYMPYADCFLVATGISEGFTELNPRRVRAFAKALGK